AGRQGRVHDALSHRQPKVLATAGRLEAVDLIDAEVFGMDAETRLQHGLAMRARRQGAHAFASSTTACAAMPSPRPVKPSFSVVVALTLTCARAAPRSAASAARIASTCGPT